MPTLFRTNIDEPVGKVNRWLLGGDGFYHQEYFTPEKWEAEYAARQSEMYWKEQVYSVFHNRITDGKGSSGQLGRSIRSKVSIDESEIGFEPAGIITFSMGNIYHTYTKKKGARKTVREPLEEEGGIRFKLGHKTVVRGHLKSSGAEVTTWEYGKFLRKGTNPSFGKYNRFFDRRMNYGMHPGVSKDYWIRWMEIFRKESFDIMVNVLQERFYKRLDD